MLFDASGSIVNKDMDGQILAALKAACNDYSEDKLAQFKASVDNMIGNMFTQAAAQPVVAILVDGNDGGEYLSQLQAQVNWAQGLDDTAFAAFFQVLINAHKKWEQEAGKSFVLLKNDYSKSSVEINGFLKAVGTIKWGGLEAEIELLKFTDNFKKD
ncbi:hypothetical protein PG984_007956 [Apiospora sp. TS-2023a]